MIGEQYALMTACLLAAALAARPATEHRAGTAGDPRAHATGQRILSPHLVRWNTSGRVTEELTAARLDADTDAARLTQPQLRVDTDTGDAWDVTAATGLMAPQGGRFEFDGRVRAAASTGVRLATEHLAIDPQRRQASSDAAVRIHSRQGDIEGTGLRADLAAGRLQLLNGVRGAHESRTD